MKRKLSIAAGVAVLSLVIVGVALAFTMGNVDGMWNTVSPYIDMDGALCDAWATGPAGGSTDYDNPAAISDNNPGIQGALGGTDWNQVRYGSTNIDYQYYCYCSTGDFAAQSGFGFDGVNDVVEPASPNVNVPFLLGKWCHFNNPIFNSACTNQNDLDYVDLAIRVDTILCPDASVPTPDGTMDFSYRFYLDETPNSPSGADCSGGYAYCPYRVGSDTYCPYQTGVNANGCADAVDIGPLPVSQGFTCTDGGVTTEYTIQILGFVPLADSTTACPSSPSGSYTTKYISQEQGDRCACLYAQISKLITAVELLSFEAIGANKSIVLDWETATETGNLGFNLLRATSVDGERTKLNTELIPTNVPPGSPFGAVYTYEDTTVKQGVAYFYWLEDVSIHGNTGLHGPVNAQAKIPGKGR